MKNTISDSRNKLAEDEEREGKTFVDFHAKLKGKDVQNLTVNDSSSSKLKMYEYNQSHIVSCFLSQSRSVPLRSNQKSGKGEGFTYIEF